VRDSPTGHALVVGAAGFAWCALALGLATTGAMNAAGGSMILSGTFYIVLAELANETLRRSAFPLFPLARTPISMEN